jgi:hypothetical protein
MTRRSRWFPVYHTWSCHLSPEIWSPKSRKHIVNNGEKLLFILVLHDLNNVLQKTDRCQDT